MSCFFLPCLLIVFFTVEIVFYQIYWSIVLKELSVWFHEAPRCILDERDDSKPGGTWFPGSVLNIAECCLLPTSYPRKMDSSVAIVWREEGRDDDPVCHLTLRDVRDQVMYALTYLSPSFPSQHFFGVFGTGFHVPDWSFIVLLRPLQHCWQAGG